MRQRQAIAGFNLQRGYALSQQLFEPGQTLRQQGIKAGRPGGLHGRDDATARAGNVFVTGALQTLLELMGTMTAIHQMGVAVDQPRGDEGTTRVVVYVAALGQRGRQIGRRTHPRNVFAFHHQSARFNQAIGRANAGLQGGNAGV